MTFLPPPPALEPCLSAYLAETALLAADDPAEAAPSLQVGLPQQLRTS